MATRGIPLRRQMEAVDCGVACLRMVLAAHGVACTTGELRALTSTSRSGATASSLLAAAAAKGLIGRGLRVNPQHLVRLSPGAILFWDGWHFVVLRLATAAYVEIADPASGVRRLTYPEVDHHFRGAALDFGPLPRRGWREWFADVQAVCRRIAGPAGWGARSLAAYTALTVVQVGTIVAVCALAGWLAERWWRPDLWPQLAALGVGLIAAPCVATVRTRLVANVVARGECALQDRLLRRVLSLPAGFFLGRGQSDLVARIRSGATLRVKLTEQVIGPVANAFVFCAVALVLLVVEWRLAAPIVAGVAAAVALTCHLRRGLRTAQAQASEARTRMHVGLLRLVGGALEVTASGFGPEAAERMREAHARELEAGRDPWPTSLAVGAVGSLRLLVPTGVFLAGLASAMPWGTILAACALGLATIHNVVCAVEATSAANELEAVIERAEQLAELEPATAAAVTTGGPTMAACPVVTAQLAEDQKPVAVTGHGLTVITGAPGTGRSALARALAGLHESPAVVTLAEPYASGKAFVPQEPYLFAGNVRSNVSLLRPDAEQEEIEQACRLAGVHDELMAMPAGYSTVIGAGGAGLPVSVCNRIALARALLRRPHLLVVDHTLDRVSDGAALAVRLRAEVAVCVVVTDDPNIVAAADAVIHR